MMSSRQRGPVQAATAAVGLTAHAASMLNDVHPQAITTASTDAFVHTVRQETVTPSLHACL